MQLCTLECIAMFYSKFISIQTVVFKSQYYDVIEWSLCAAVNFIQQKMTNSTAVQLGHHSATGSSMFQFNSAASLLFAALLPPAAMHQHCDALQTSVQQLCINTVMHCRQVQSNASWCYGSIVQCSYFRSRLYASTF